MADHYGWQLAMRTRAMTLSLNATGSVSLSATAAGYNRASGSFLTDGFLVGMEVTAAGFGLSANNGPHTITKVTATDIEVNGGCTAEAAAGGRSLTVGLPAQRSWENVKLTPTAHMPYVLEQYIPGPANLQTGGQQGRMIYEPMYSLSIYGVAKTGLGGVAKYVDGLLNLFPPKLALSLASGDILRVRGDMAPFRGQMIFRDEAPDHAVVPVTIPFRVETFNSL